MQVMAVAVAIDDRTDVLGHLAEYLGRSKSDVICDLNVWGNSQVPLARLWREMQPQTPEEFDRFYQDGKGLYLPDLVAFNTSPYYWQRASLSLKVSGRVVDFGGGIGTLSIALAQQGCEVTYVDLESPQRRFAEWRFRRLGLPVKVVSSLHEVDAVDHLDAVDVMEHIHPQVLPEVIGEFARIVRKGGTVNTINDFGAQPDLPQHQNTEMEFDRLMRKAGFWGGSVRWMKALV